MDLWHTFIDAVSRCFTFLEEDYGFRLKTVQVPFVIYAKDYLEVHIYYGVDRVHELDLGIVHTGETNKNEPSIGINEILLLSKHRSKDRYQTVYPKDEKNICYEVQKLASILHDHGQGLLKSDPSVLNELMSLRQHATQEINARGNQGVRH